MLCRIEWEKLIASVFLCAFFYAAFLIKCKLILIFIKAGKVFCTIVVIITLLIPLQQSAHIHIGGFSLDLLLPRVPTVKSVEQIGQGLAAFYFLFV